MTTYTLTMDRPLSRADYRVIRMCTLNLISEYRHAPEGTTLARQRDMLKGGLVRVRYGYWVMGPGNYLNSIGQ